MLLSTQSLTLFNSFFLFTQEFGLSHLCRILISSTIRMRTLKKNGVRLNQFIFASKKLLNFFFPFVGKWLLQLVEYYFTKSFRESLCNFPSSPVNQENGKLFGETIAKLALHHLLRLAASTHQQKTPTSPVADWTPKDLFSLDIDAFVSHFFSYFGLSFDSIFQCVRIGANGLPTSVCHHRLSAWAIGNHVQEFHTLQMTSDRAQKELVLTPFFLVFQPSLSPPLAHKECDTGLLNWARSTVEHYRGHAYLEVLELVSKLSGNESDNRKPGPKRAPAAKRKRLSTGSESQRVPRPRL